MGQGEIFQFLIENEGQIFTAKEICMALDRTTASSALLRLRKYPPEGFNSSKENLLSDVNRYGKTWFSKAKIYIYWYKKQGG
ncbi:MAG: hypothetical protein ACE5J5_04990 [Candidatus Hydrothermarchaeales archaeon]